MEFSCNSDYLKAALAKTEKAISNQSTVKILENLYFELDQNQLTIRGYNLTLGIEAKLPLTEVKSSGRVLIKAKTVRDIIGKFENETVFFNCDNNQNVALKSERFSFDLRGQSCEEYPIFPSIDTDMTFSLSVMQLKQLLHYTVFSVATDETQSMLNGVFFVKEAGELTCVGSDGYRLAIQTIDFVDKSDAVTSILPLRSMQELLKLLQNQDEDKLVSVTITNNQAVFKMDGFLLITRVIQGQFPSYKHIIPNETKYRFRLSKRQLLASSERAIIIAAESSFVVRNVFSRKHVALSAKAVGIGTFDESVEVQCLCAEDDQLSVAFNVKLIIEGLRYIDSDELIIAFDNTLSPCSITSVSDDGFTYVLMPIRLSDSVESPEKDVAAVPQT